MSFLVVLCEGHTEMNFVKTVLHPHLLLFGTTCQPILLGKKVKHDQATSQGGIFKYEPVYRHIQSTLRQYSAETSFVTTMIDFYAFPRDFEGYENLALEPDATKRVLAFEEAIWNQFKRNPRLIPYIQLHEFEALIFARIEVLRELLKDNDEAQTGINALVADTEKLQPEEIDQSATTAPSKRLLRFVPAYHKRSMGPTLVQQIGLNTLRATCPHFGAWLDRLDKL